MHLINNSEAYFGVLARAMRDVLYPCVDRIATDLLHAYSSGRSIYLLGNGGSASTASHFACDLGKGTTKALSPGARRFRVIALTDNVPTMTAWANDCSYDDMFAEQLKNLVSPGDVVVAISGSGNSPNILKALEVAVEGGAYTIGLTGFRGGKMKPLCRTCLVVPSENMEIIEDVHMATCHAIATVIRHTLGRDASIAAGAPDRHRVPCSVSVTKVMNTENDELPIVEFGAASSAAPALYDGVEHRGPARN